MKKKLAAIALVIVMVAMLFTGLTIAYFTDTEEATNVFTIGDIDITLTEPSWDPDEDGADDKDEDGKADVLENIVPGFAYPKNPTVENIGDNDAYVRMLVTVPGALQTALSGVTELNDVLVGYNADTWPRANGSPINNNDGTVTYIFNYFKKLTNTDGKVTLFTHFKLPEDLTMTDLKDLAEMEVFSIVVTAQAIQAEGFETREAAFAALTEELS